MERPYKYSDTMMVFISLWTATVNESYRDCWGYLTESWGESKAPHYTTLWRRMGDNIPLFEPIPNSASKTAWRG